MGAAKTLPGELPRRRRGPCKVPVGCPTKTPNWQTQDKRECDERLPVLVSAVSRQHAALVRRCAQPRVVIGVKAQAAAAAQQQQASSVTGKSRHLVLFISSIMPGAPQRRPGAQLKLLSSETRRTVPVVTTTPRRPTDCTTATRLHPRGSRQNALALRGRPLSDPPEHALVVLHMLGDAHARADYDAADGWVVQRPAHRDVGDARAVLPAAAHPEGTWHC